MLCANMCMFWDIAFIYDFVGLGQFFRSDFQTSHRLSFHTFYGVSGPFYACFTYGCAVQKYFLRYCTHFDCIGLTHFLWWNLNLADVRLFRIFSLLFGFPSAHGVFSTQPQSAQWEKLCCSSPLIWSIIHQGAWMNIPGYVFVR